ncbi:4'-phosphopantetheinyl transferase family protein [Spongiimicrobium salis]|uniref:4'-phosphopantetheinyl transferase family protein n=1 Tax=Spongiimicrobium salis TaxID=1667022 RepID=UPI00374DD0D4
MTSVYYTFCKKLSNYEYTRAISLLPIMMQRRARRYHRWQDSHAYLYGKLLLKYGLRQLGKDDSLMTMRKSKQGKPYFEDDSLSFNISHSGEYIVCAISHCHYKTIGIDIEEMKPVVFTDFDSVWSPQEKKEINSIEKFYRFWTRKEAIVKADGRGLSIPLKTIDTTKLTVVVNNNTYYLSELEIDRKYSTHVATLGKVEKNNPINCVFITAYALCDIYDSEML